MTTQRVAVVTGATRGIGLEVCRQLAAQGLTVILAGRSLADAEARAAELDGDVHALQLDVTYESSRTRFATDVTAAYGRCDVLVNNAGILESWEGGSRFLDMPLEAFERTLQTNVHGPVRMSQLLVPLMVAQSYGRVVNVSSGMGQLSEMGSGYAAYRISKTALNSLTVLLAKELKGTGVTVNAVCPGWVRTDMGGSNAGRSVEQGADTIVWLATHPDGGPTGSFFRDRAPIAW